MSVVLVVKIVMQHLDFGLNFGHPIVAIWVSEIQNTRAPTI